MRGIVIACVGGLYTVRTEAGDVSCRARGAFRHEGVRPLCGDEVETDGEAVDEVCPRSTVLTRPPVANVGALCIAAAPRLPQPVLLTIDKLTVCAEISRVEPVIVVTKRELDEEGARKLADLYRGCGYRTFETSAVSGYGVEELRGWLTGCAPAVTAFAGASGVGKSTLLHALFPDISAETGELSRRVGRGRQTTRAVTLYQTSPGRFLADTPGFSLIEPERIAALTSQTLPDAFREFSPYLTRCRYVGCTHTKEEGCAVIAAAERGEVARSRFDSYLELYAAVKDKRPWNTPGGGDGADNMSADASGREKGGD